MKHNNLKGTNCLLFTPIQVANWDKWIAKFGVLISRIYLNGFG